MSSSLWIERSVVDPERVESVEVPIQALDEAAVVLLVVLGRGSPTSPREDNDAVLTCQGTHKSPPGLAETIGTPFA